MNIDHVLYDEAVGPPTPHHPHRVQGRPWDIDPGYEKVPKSPVVYYRADMHPDRCPIPHPDRVGLSRSPAVTDRKVLAGLWAMLNE